MNPSAIMNISRDYFHMSVCLPQSQSPSPFSTINSSSLRLLPSSNLPLQRVSFTSSPKWGVHHHHHKTIVACMSPSPAKQLRQILELPGVHQGPACFDALSAKLVQKAGFQFCFTSGFSISAARLGLPDNGFLSYGEMVDQGQQITQAVSIPVIGDGDNGYGNAMNVKRTVNGYIRAGFAGIILEDQVVTNSMAVLRSYQLV